MSRLGVDDARPEHSQFLTSDQCEGCHEAGGAGQLDRPYMVEDGAQGEVDLSPWAEWSASPMGLAGRDPIFHAQLELERNIARDQPGLAEIPPCIDNTCLHCHGAAGARQYNIDTAGQSPEGDPCADFLPPQDQRRATDYDGARFTQDMVFGALIRPPESRTSPGPVGRSPGFGAGVCWFSVNATDSGGLQRRDSTARGLPSLRSAASSSARARPGCPRCARPLRRPGPALRAPGAMVRG